MKNVTDFYIRCPKIIIFTSFFAISGYLKKVVMRWMVVWGCLRGAYAQFKWFGGQSRIPIFQNSVKILLLPIIRKVLNVECTRIIGKPRYGYISIYIYIYISHVACLTYHTLRQNEHVSEHLLNSTSRTIVKQCPVAKHLTLAHFGRVGLRYSPPHPLQPSPAGFAATQTHNTLRPGPGHGPRSLSSSAQPHHQNRQDNRQTPSFQQNGRLRMSHQRVAVLRARGITVASGPLFPSRHSRSADARTGERQLNAAE